MTRYRIHPIVMGTKQFDKGMMTYQHDYGKPYTIPHLLLVSGGGKPHHHRGYRRNEPGPVRGP